MSANRIYFAQHGLAVNKSENTDRPLSVEGITQTQAIADQLKLASIPISHVFHSGKLRAQQTAEIFSASLSISEMTILDHMSPNDDYHLLINELNIDNALYVGHLPFLEKLISTLLTNDDSSHLIQFKNSAVVCLESNAVGYSIKWYLTPELLMTTSN